MTGPQDPRPSSDDLQRRLDWMTAYVDALLGAGEQLAVKLCEVDSSPWTEQILDEWQTAKDYPA